MTVAEQSQQAIHGRHRPNPNYPATIREYARRLADENGWTAYRIRHALHGRVDPVPSEHTIRLWVDPDYYDEHLRRERNYRKPGIPGKKAWQLRLDRMRELRESAGLSASSTARVMSHDFDLDLSRHQVEALLAGRVKKTKTIRKLLYPQGAQT